MEINGIIQTINVSNGAGPSGRPWTRWEYIVNSQKYSTFKKEIGEKFKVGDVVLIKGEKGDKFFDMKTMEIAKPFECPTVKVGVPQEIKVNNGTSMERMSALKSAVTFAGNSTGDVDIIGIAEDFLKWIHGKN